MGLFRVEGIGRLGNDPEMQFLESGDNVTRFSVAFDQGTKEKPKTLWVRCSAWGKLGEVCNEYLHKGKQVYIEGSNLQSKHFTGKEDGEIHDTLELSIYKMVMTGSKDDDDRPAREQRDERPTREARDTRRRGASEEEDTGGMPF